MQPSRRRHSVFLCFFAISLPLVQTRVFRASPQFFTTRRRSAVIAFLKGFPQNILAPTVKIPEKPHFLGLFNAKPITEKALL